MKEALSTGRMWPDVDDLPDSQGLPDPLVGWDGRPVESAREWREARRPELISLFEHYLYGKAPPAPDNLTSTVDDVDPHALGGRATRKILTLRFGPAGTPPVSLLLVVPNRREGPAPVFVGLNFTGNHTTLSDPAIPLPTAWVEDEWTGGTGGRADESQRGIRGEGGRKPRWCFGRAVDRGYAVATLYAGEISPDHPERAFSEGVHRGYLAKGQTGPGPHDWAVIASWAWGLQRAVDALVRDPDLDAERIIAIGHSRMGKAALWAAALDERVAMAIPSQAGCGGTSPARTSVGETVAMITRQFPHWFTPTYARFADRVERLPFDQHALIALMAPRPVLLTNATEDTHANPRGQFDMLRAASPVYALHGVEGLTASEFPAEHVLLDSCLGFHIRPGVHDMTSVEWDAWLGFADRHLGRPGEGRTTPWT